MVRTHQTVLIFLLLALGLSFSSKQPGGVAAQAATLSCATPWSLPNVKLKDHTLFRYQDHFYLMSIRIELPAKDERGEYAFAYARTLDFCTWEDLGTVLGPGAPGDADESYIWAPHVVEENGTFFMFYTGVNRNIAQSTMLAISTNPADPQSWIKQGVVFRPQHTGMVYAGPDSWSDARDPMILRYNGRYYMYYTGRDLSGGIVGVAVADQLLGPWRDLGAVLGTSSSTMPESPFVVPYEGHFYLYSNDSGPDGAGAVWRRGSSPFGPWQPAVKEPLGWAHDFYLSGHGWYASYVIGNGVAIGVTPLRWDTTVWPPSPRIGWRTLLPLAVAGADT